MQEHSTLNKLEHYILSGTVDGIEPFYVIYRLTMDEIEEATLDSIIAALIKLIDMEFVNCFIDFHGRKPCENLTEEHLKLHCASRADKELREYPFDINWEYEFHVTKKGRAEERKDIYNEYYPA